MNRALNIILVVLQIFIAAALVYFLQIHNKLLKLVLSLLIGVSVAIVFSFPDIIKKIKTKSHFQKKTKNKEFEKDVVEWLIDETISVIPLDFTEFMSSLFKKDMFFQDVIRIRENNAQLEKLKNEQANLINFLDIRTKLMNAEKIDEIQSYFDQFIQIKEKINNETILHEAEHLITDINKKLEL